jgi:hypothetical protein
LCKKISGRIKKQGPADHKWVNLEELEKFPFHKSNQKIIPKLVSVFREIK